MPVQRHVGLVARCSSEMRTQRHAVPEASCSRDMLVQRPRAKMPAAPEMEVQRPEAPEAFHVPCIPIECGRWDVGFRV